MQLKDFTTLEYKDKLRVLNQSGKLHKLVTFNQYQFTLYRVMDFYVELKRNLNELYFDTIVAMPYDDLPTIYK
jgi:hypothetical protein